MLTFKQHDGPEPPTIYEATHMPGNFYVDGQRIALIGSSLAKKFAAAPDLLEALRSVLADHRRCAESKTQGGPIRDAYAAIAKAEGR